MKALVYKGDRYMELDADYPTPVPNDDELLIKVKSIGVCGSDVEGYLGKTGRRVAPMIMGHELAGEVVQVTKDSRFQLGDQVVIQPKLYCGECIACKTGRTNICPHGKFLGVMSKDGGLAEYVAVPERYLFRTSIDLPWEHACMVEPLSVAYHAVAKLSEEQLKQAGPVLVIGAGPIGLLVLQVLKYRGVKEVIVSDLSDYRLEKAKKLGACCVLNPSNDEMPSGIDYCFEAVGISATANQSLNSLSVGGTVVWIGNAQKMIEVNMQAIVTRELNIVGSYIFNDSDFGECLRLIEQGQIDIDSMITVEHGLEKGVELFAMLGEGNTDSTIKVVLIV